jgi:hypothetical protein
MRGRARWLKIAAGVWLVLVSGIAIVDSVGLSRLIEQSRSSAQDAQVQALATRVSDLEHQAEAAKRQPKPVVQGDFDAARQALEERLAHVEQAQAADAHGDDIKALQARVGVLEARLKKRAPSATAPRKTAERPSPKCPNRHSTWSVWSCAAANASCRSHRTAPWRLPTCGCCARVSRSVPGNSRPSTRMPSSSAWTTRPCASRCRRSVP